MAARTFNPTLEKCPTGIRGLDEILQGGLPRGRPTLVCGPAGSGKTLLAMEFIARGARDFKEPGAFMAFEETETDLAQNVASLGFDLKAMARRKLIAMDHVAVQRSEIEEAGEYDLEGLFVRLGSMIERIGARRVAIDSLEALFSAFSNEAIVRAELHRLFRWLKDRNLTAVITGEQGSNTLTRHGLEEYVSDCVIFLDHRVVEQVATRRLRVVKYRGSAHGTNEYPSLIDEEGFSVFPISTLGLDYPVSRKRVSTGIAELDGMFGGGGYYRGSSVLVSGSAGTCKSSVATAFTEAACRRGERSLYISLEESPAQIVRNMASIGYDLEKWVRKGLLRFHAVRPVRYGLEQHLVRIYTLVEEFKPEVLVLDPISNLGSVGRQEEVDAMLVRMIDFLKNRAITAVFTCLTAERTSEAEASSLMDTWLVLGMAEANGAHPRRIHILKSRGMLHSSQVCGFDLTDKGIRIAPAQDRAAPGCANPN
jgi:circadian clock protein KaiC